MAPTPERIAVCQNEHSERCWWPLDPHEIPDCPMECDCTPKVYVEEGTLIVDATTPRYELDVSEFDPKPTSTIVLTLPAQTHGEVFEVAQQFLREKFPENKIIVMHADATLEEKDE